MDAEFAQPPTAIKRPSNKTSITFLLQITLCGTILKSIITQISSSHPGGRR